MSAKISVSGRQHVVYIPRGSRRVIKTSSFGIDPQGRSTFIHTVLSIDFRLVGPPNDYLIFHQFISAIGVRVRISHYRQFISIFAKLSLSSRFCAVFIPPFSSGHERFPRMWVTVVGWWWCSSTLVSSAASKLHLTNQ